MKLSSEKGARDASDLEKAVSHFSSSVVKFHEEVGDHLTQNGFLTPVVATGGYCLRYLIAGTFRIQTNNIYLAKY